MPTVLRDLMLVCRNGHVITDRLRANPDWHVPRCDRCGADTIDRCETCGHLLGGANAVPGLEPVASRCAPMACTICGAAFPWTKPDDGPDDAPLFRLEHMLRRLPRVAFELGRRERAPLTIADEGDLDDLVRALLPIEFDDVRTERRTPPYSQRTRIAFFLPELGTRIVAHLIGPSIDETEMDRRRAIDLDEHCRRSLGERLMLLIVDPDCRLPNPERLEAVWSRSEGRPEVRCVIVT